MRRHWAAMLPAAVAVLLALGAVPAQASAQPAPGEDRIVYNVDVVSNNEVEGEASYTDVVEIACQASTCRPVYLTGYYSGMPDGPVTFAVPGTLSFTSSTQGNGCDPLSAPVHVEYAFTESTVSATAVAEKGTITCEGESGPVAAGSMTIEGTIAEGQCHFTPQGCEVVAMPDPAAETILTYSVDVEDSNQVAGGDVPDSVVVACDGTTCRLVAFPRLFGLTDAAPAFTVPGTLAFTADAQGGSCDATPAGPFVVELAFTATSVSGTAEKSEWSIACGDGELRALGQTVGVTGDLVEGACYFTQEGCDGEAAEPVGESEVDEGTVLPVAGEDGAGGDAGSDAGTSSRLASGDPAAPSVLSALRPPAEAGIAPQQLALAALITVILVLLMSFPTSLLNSAIDGASDRFAAWRERRGAAKAPKWRGSWWWAAIGVLAAAVISAFVDPQFGANPGSLRMLVSIGLGFAVDVVLGWVVLQWVMRRLAPDATRSFSFKPLTLLIVVGAVVFTRITGFEPGIVFGLVAGLGFATTVGITAKARTTLVPLAYAFGLGIVAWFVFGALADRSGESLGMTLLVETLSSLTVGGMVALPLALVPVKGLSGHTVWQSSRRLWAGSYGIGLLAFLIVLMPMPFSWAEVGWDLWAWIGVFVAYAVVAVAAWLIVKRPWRKEQPPDSAATEEPATQPPAEPTQETAPAIAPLQEEQA